MLASSGVIGVVLLMFEYLCDFLTQHSVYGVRIGVEGFDCA